MPQHWVSTVGEENFPLFTPMLVAGIKRYIEKRNQSDSWQGFKSVKEYASQLEINPKTIQRALPDLISRGLARRGKIDLRQAAK